MLTESNSEKLGYFINTWHFKTLYNIIITNSEIKYVWLTVAKMLSTTTKSLNYRCAYDTGRVFERYKINGLFFFDLSNLHTLAKGRIILPQGA